MRAVIAEGPALLREDLIGILNELGAANDVIISGTLADTASHIRAHGTDLALIDLCVPGLSGLADLVELVNLATPAKLVVMADRHPPAIHRQFRICGVAGLMEISDPPHQIRRTLTMVLRGGLGFPDTLAIPTGTRCPEQQATLTPKQLTVLEQLTKGKSNKQIAKDLELSPNTVKAHVSEVLRRLGVTSRAEAIALTHAPWIPQFVEA